MSDGLCNGISFNVSEGHGPNYIVGRYKLGFVQQGILFLDPYECLYLYFKGRITFEDSEESALKKLFSITSVERYTAYTLLKNKGYRVHEDNGTIFFRKSTEIPRSVVVVREYDEIDVGKFFTERPDFYFTVDEEGDATIYRIDEIDIKGTENNKIGKCSVTDFGDRHFTKDDLPHWMGTKFHEYRMLTDFEANLIEGKEPKGMAEEVYRDLLSRGCIVKTGFKYGTNFRVYEGEKSEHAEYLVSVVENKLIWYYISRAVRVASSVRKKMIFTTIIDGKIKYIMISRSKDIVI
ncbi:tRNA intron endonuclease [Thermoplasma volcanium GSS1]|uniref:tRNA-splicing endonuclease n=1 Tax=Thermoplasma volcanium (strain ATCC 51530 / DSM 4299 / JCM 9571 / NBRC 15438 / GSS1) TaxID=273116 RepID=ENDA_THEVO|nr:tRNA-intron lyase [Thermoplasma volcanium]Q97BQ3.1 RecName: Full=tRNA-splicing endonuclease; AltName: Full=tRNA-intron endonuclease [Thermoplasma volcanium GSS1]BAB59544.1 tRNA intron endonuclease [Thermoplasma volcanium GSS1]